MQNANEQGPFFQSEAFGCAVQNRTGPPPVWRERPPVQAAMSRATLPLSEGIAALELPNRLSAESLEDLREWMEMMLRRAERVVARTQQAGAAPEENGASRSELGHPPFQLRIEAA